MSMMFVLLIPWFLSTSCEQEFTLLGFILGEPSTFWILEDVGGECNYSRLIQISLSKDRKINEGASFFAQYKQTKKFQESISELNHVNVDTLISKNGRLTVPSKSWLLSPPPLNDSLYGEYSYNANANFTPAQWNTEKAVKGIMQPNFENCTSQLLYIYPNGLYVNYDFDKGYYLRDRGLIIIFTKNQHRGSGLDSMYGFLIYQVKDV